ncbi:MAG: sigma-54 dependent transcriptional regulator [Bacteroidetes bacterium]|nr:sigma-54 dependent transcriptional regulator [Bacteroidota bacterium]
MGDFTLQTDQFIADIQKQFGIIGQSVAIKKAMKTLIDIASTNLAVLITGDTGTGKEVFANAVHNLSPRKDRHFVSVNCGAIPETLLESELFGHEKGAFTDAKSQRIGFFEAADNGSIFLDEIGEMPVATQVKLLRVLESGEYSRLGSSKINKVNVRIIAATNRDISNAVSKKTFRADLYYRLNQINIELPSLRERIDDIPMLFEHFAKATCKKNKIIYKSISNDAIKTLMSLSWDGNIREFKSFVEKIITLEKGDFITPEILNKYLPEPPTEPNYEITNALVPIRSSNEVMSNDSLILRTLLEVKNDISGIKQILGQFGDALVYIKNDTMAINDYLAAYDKNVDNDFIDYFADKDIPTIKDMEKELITAAMKKYNNKKREVAVLLGISDRTLYRKLIEYEII